MAAFTQATNLYNPIFLYALASTSYGSLPKSSSNTFLSFALSDTLSILDDRAQLLLGLRQQGIQSIIYAVTGAVTSSYSAIAVTPSIGLLVKLAPYVSLYGSYIEALNQGPTAPNTAVNAGQVFALMRSRQFEAGAKLDFRTWSATLGRRRPR